MYNTSTAVTQRIESYCRTWRVWLEDSTTREVIMGSAVMSASSDAQSTASANDIEFGAVCSGQWNVSLSDTKGKSFLGREFYLYFCLIDLSGEMPVTYEMLRRYSYKALSEITCKQIKEMGEQPMTYGQLHKYSYGSLSSMTAKQIRQLSQTFGERIPMGKFTCVRCRKNGKGAELAIADRLYFSDAEYRSGLKYPTTAKMVEYEICGKLGMSCGIDYGEKMGLNAKGARLYDSGNVRLRTRSYNFEISEKPPKGTTMRQMLSYIASAEGQFGVVDRNGKYVRRWYGKPVKLLDNNTIDLPTLSEKPNKITGIVCKVSDDLTYSLGDCTGKTGRVMEFQNYLMTQPLFRSLYYRITAVGMEWYTAEVYQRLGDPRLDVGDVVVYNDGANSYNIPITNQSFSFDGGLSCTLKAAGISIEEQIPTELEV